MSAAGALRPGRTLAIHPIVAALVTGALVGLIAAYQPIGAIGLALAPVIAAIALYRLPIAVAMWIPLMFIEGLPGSRLAPELFGLFVGIGWVAALRLGTLNGAFQDARNLLLGLGAMISWFWLSLIWANDAGAVAGYAWYFIEVAIFVIVIATVPRDVATVKLFFAMFVVGAVLSVAIGQVGVLSGDAAVAQGDRLQGGAGDPNYFAAALMPALAITIGLARAANTRAGRYWSLAATLPLIYGVAASQSRGALLAACVMSIAALCVFPRERGAILLCIVAVIGVGSLYFVTDRGAWERITHDKYGGSGREDLWLIGTRVIRDHPLFGVGLNNFSKVSTSYVREPGNLTYVKGIQRGQELHNAYLAMLAEVGPLGLLLFLFAPVWCLGSALSAARRFDAARMGAMSALARAAFVGLCGTLTTSFFLPNAADKRLWVLMALIVAITTLSRRVAERDAEAVSWSGLGSPRAAPAPVALSPGVS